MYPGTHRGIILLYVAGSHSVHIHRGTFPWKIPAFNWLHSNHQSDCLNSSWQLTTRMPLQQTQPHWLHHCLTALLPRTSRPYHKPKNASPPDRWCNSSWGSWGSLKLDAESASGRVVPHSGNAPTQHAHHKHTVHKHTHTLPTIHPHNTHTQPHVRTHTQLYTYVHNTLATNTYITYHLHTWIIEVRRHWYKEAVLTWGRSCREWENRWRGVTNMHFV